jgi:hypothetical protein
MMQEAEACDLCWLKSDLRQAEKRIEELERGRCEDCGATLTLDGCVLCGAPVCCPQCCRLQSLADRVAELEEHRAPNPGAVGTIRDKSILLKYKDMQIAQLQTARAVEKESRAMKESLEVQQ